MIHYHGTPVSGPKSDVGRFLQGRHALIPFFYQDDLAIAMEVCQSVLFDNSAYTLWKSGKLQTTAELIKWVTDYISWCYEWFRHPALDGFLINDKVDGSEADNDALLADWPDDLKGFGIPVWHLHESLDRLERLVYLFPTVALGSSGQWPNPGTPSWWKRMNDVMKVACDESGRPRCRLHGLRMLDPEIFKHLPLASADSTNAAVNSGSLKRFGMYKPPTAAQRAEVIAERIEAYNSAPVWTGYEQSELDGFQLLASAER